MNFAFLERHEQLLAQLWRGWSHSSRLLKIVFLTTPSQYRSLLRIVTMLSNQRRFLATNNPVFLSKALAEYFILRDLWIKTVRHGTSAKAIFSGWGAADALQTIKKATSGIGIRRVFRPDVWYLNRGSLGLFAGFEFIGTLDQVKKLYRAVEPSGFFSNSSSKYPERPRLKFESLNPSRNQRASHWYSTFALAPQAVTQMIEYASDSEMASIISSVYGEIPELFISDEVSRSILIMKLIAKDAPTLNSGWRKVGIGEPDWVFVGESPKSSGEKLAEKYFVANEVELMNGGIILSDGNFLNWDSSQHPSLDFVAGNANFVVGTMGNLRECFVRQLPTGQQFGEAILLGSRVDSNWFHFLIETLPRLLVLEDGISLAVPILVSDRLPASAIEAIRSLTSRRIEIIDTQTVTLVAKAYVAGPVIYHPDSQFMWDRESGQAVNVEMLVKLRNRILRNRNLKKSLGKTYFERKSSHRGLLNAKSISKLARNKGYEIVNPTDLTFDEQVKLFYESKEILCVGGAVMANFIFANETTTITLLVSSFISEYRMPRLLSEISGSKIQVVAGHTLLSGTRKSYLHKIHSSFLINQGKLGRLLSLIEH